RAAARAWRDPATGGWQAGTRRCRPRRSRSHSCPAAARILPERYCSDMNTTVEQFARECHTILKSEPGPSGRRKICMRLEQLLRDPRFVAAALDESTPERHLLYEDPELGFCLLAHNYKGAKS